jgi:hypothetical protein
MLVSSLMLVWPHTLEILVGVGSTFSNWGLVVKVLGLSD